MPSFLELFLGLRLLSAADFSRFLIRIPLIFRDVHENVSPRIIFRPDNGCLNSRSRLPRRLQQIKGHVHDRALHLFVPGLAKGISQWKVRKKETRHAAFLDNIPRRADNNGGNVVFFEMPGYQTHGLVTDRSNRRKNYGINAILFAKLKHLRRKFF